jgi:hypothetical protein
MNVERVDQSSESGIVFGISCTLLQQFVLLALSVTENLQL